MGEIEEYKKYSQQNMTSKQKVGKNVYNFPRKKSRM